MGMIYKDGARFGGFFSGPAQDIFFDHRETICSSSNVQGAIKELSNLFDNGKGIGSIPAKESCGIVSSDGESFITVPSVSSTGIPNISVNDVEIGALIVSKNEADSENHEVKSIQVGVNPNTSNIALIVKWFDGTNEQINYIDF